MWLVAAAIGTIATPAFAHASDLFVPWVRLFETGVSAKSIALSDLDGDGDLDLVTHDGGQYSILLGSGDGTFGTSLDFTATPSACSEPAIGDLNGDSKPDLAIGDFGSNTVAVLLGHGDGTFGPRTDFTTGNTPGSVAIGDLDGDARQDLAVANVGSGTISVLLGNGDGTFAPKLDYAAGEEPTSLGLADFNRDGHLDAAVYSPSFRLISVLPNSGNGSLGSRREWNDDVGDDPFPGQFVIGDYSGDGNVDLIVIGFFCNLFMLGRGDGTFDPGEPGQLCGFDTYALVTSGDPDGDGTLDLLALSRLGDHRGYIYSSLSLWNRDGVQDITRIGDGWGGNWPPLGGALGDVNGDGETDLAMAGAFGQSAAVMLALSDGSFPQRTEYRYSSPSFPGGPTSITGGDVDSDRRSDLLVGIRAADNASVAVYRSAGPNGQAALGPGSYPGSLAFGDLSHDGIVDLAVVNLYPLPSQTVLGRSNGSFAPAVDIVPGPGPKSFTIGDFDRDGRGDLAVTHGNDSYASPADSLSIFLGNGDGTIGAPILLTADGPFGDVHAVDLDQDGLMDLLVPVATDVRVLRGRGDGGFDPIMSFPAGGSVNDLVVADFDRDGRLDVAAALGNGTSMLLGFGDGTLSAPHMEAGRATGAIVAADFDGDGRLDLAFNSTGISIILGRGDGTFGTRTNLGADFGGNWDLALVGPDAQDHLKLATGGAYDPAVILLTGNVDRPVGTLLLVFEAAPTATGIEVRWRIEDSEHMVTTVLERAEHQVGPWSPVTSQRREAEGVTIATDDAVTPGRVYYYRLVAAAGSAAPIVFGPISAATGGAAGKLSLSVGPNPSRQQARFEFEIPFQCKVRLVVLDLQGRILSTLSDGMLEAGRHQRIWNGVGPSHAAGAYFVRLETPRQVLWRRFVLLK